MNSRFQTLDVGGARMLKENQLEGAVTEARRRGDHETAIAKSDELVKVLLREVGGGDIAQKIRLQTVQDYRALRRDAKAHDILQQIGSAAGTPQELIITPPPLPADFDRAATYVEQKGGGEVSFLRRAASSLRLARDGHLYDAERALGALSRSANDAYSQSEADLFLAWVWFAQRRQHDGVRKLFDLINESLAVPDGGLVYTQAVAAGTLAHLGRELFSMFRASRGSCFDRLMLRQAHASTSSA